MSILKRYWGSLRRLRFLHWLYNLTKYGQLKGNKKLYEKYGIDKSVVRSISHNDISNPGKDIPWLDQPGGTEKLKSDPFLAHFNHDWQEEILNWQERGYMILRNFASAETCDRINADLERIISSKELDFDYTNSRVMNAWQKSETIRSLVKDEKLHDFLSFTLGKEVQPFQTISFLKGSRQKTHSDFIHMTTEPVGYLIATWMALEDIAPDSGPLHYYPGSHKLPYILGEDFDHDSNAISVGDDLYGNYEKEIAKQIEEKKLKKEVFLPKKGDLLIWHANLLHGGETVTNENSTRRSLVTHYYCKGEVLCYHEITQRPAVFPEI